jgi:hypothetical protein
MGLQKRLWQAEKANRARATGFYHVKPLKVFDTPRRPTPVSDGVKRAAKLIAARTKAHADRLAGRPYQAGI